MDPTAILKKYVEERKSRRTQLADRIAVLERKVASLDMAIEDMEKAIAEMESHSPAPVQQANGLNGTGQEEHQTEQLAFVRPRPGRPRSASPSLIVRPAQKVSHLCLEFVNSHPEGMRPSEIADLLAGRMVESKSTDPRRVVMNTLINLATRGKVRRDDDGKYRPAKNDDKDDLSDP